MAPVSETSDPDRGPTPTAEGETRFITPTGTPCPRAVRLDGTVEGSGNCCDCGYCMLLEWAAWGRD